MQEQNTISAPDTSAIKDVFTIVGDALKLIWAHRGNVVKMCWKYLVFLVLINLPVAILYVGLLSKLEGADNAQIERLFREHIPAAIGGLSLLILLAAVNILVSIFISIRFQVYFAGVIKNGEQKMISVREIFSKYFGHFLLITLIGGLVGIGAAFPLFIPLIILGIYISFALPAFFMDGKKGIDALVASYSLARGRFWMVVGRFIVINLVVLAIYMGITMAGFLINLVIGIISAVFPSFALASFFTGGLIQIITNVVTSVLFSTFVLVLYKNLSDAGPVSGTSLEKAKKVVKFFMWLGVFWLSLIVIIPVVLNILN